MASKKKPPIDLPEATANTMITQLTDLNAYEEMSRKTYAFLAYREEKLTQKKWLIKIKANQTAGSTIDPEDPLIRYLISNAAQAGKPYALIGVNLSPRPGDCRMLENRLYFDATLTPVRVEIHLQLRQQDGSPMPVKIAMFPWPEDTDLFSSSHRQRLALPKATVQFHFFQLAYLDDYDVISDRDYAFLAYKEQQTASRQWTVRIKSKETASTTIDPDNPSLKRAIMEAADQGESYVLFGFHITPKPGDPRRVEIRIHFLRDYQISQVSIHLVVRNADHSAKQEKSTAFDWPQPTTPKPFTL